MRTLTVLLVSLFGASCLAQELKVLPPGTSLQVLAAKVPQTRYSVDLAKPGALDELERNNPDHYAKVMAVRHAASQPSCMEELKVLRVELQLEDASCAAMTMLTSDPPKKNVSVQIDGVRYMTYAAYSLTPARAARLAPAPKILPSEP